MREEMLFTKELVTDTKGSSIFQVLQAYLQEKDIPMNMMIACATDGAPSMVGKYRGFLAHVKQIVPDILTIHCVLHRQNLVAKSLSERLHNSLQVVIKVVNKIKAHSLNDRIFREICKDNDEIFVRLLLHTEVRWLSKGACLSRFFSLFDSILTFLREHDQNLFESVLRIKNDIAYLTDFFEKMNEVQTKLQGADQTLVKAKGIISAFLSKLSLFNAQLLRGDFHSFARLSGCSNVDDDAIRAYTEHIEKVRLDMLERFKDLLSFEIADWIINPYSANVSTVESKLQEEFIDLQHDEEAKCTFKLHGYKDFWISLRYKYPVLWGTVKLLLIAFLTSYLVEKGFSAVSKLLTKERSRLNVEKKGDLRLYLTKLEPDIEKLAEQHQAQGSH